jgi:hypothetical protein
MSSQKKNFINKLISLKNTNKPNDNKNDCDNNITIQSSSYDNNVLKEKNETNAKTIFKMVDDNKKQNAIIIELRETIDNKIKGNKDIVGKINEIRKIDAFYSKCLIIILQQTVLQLKYGGEFIYMLNMINSNNNKVEGVFNILKPILLEYFYNYLPGINLNLK